MVKHSSGVQVVKTVKQNYNPSNEILELLNDFRLMMNDCIHIGLKENVTSMKSLSLKCYHALSQYDVATYYRLTASSKAAGILRNYRKSLKKNSDTKTPYVKNLQLVDCYGFKIQGKRLRLTLRAHEYVYIDLNPHTLAVISGYTVRSIVLTTCTLNISFSKEMVEIEPAGLIGIDRNLNNITVASSGGTVQTLDLSKATDIKSRYREVKSHLKRNDVRIMKRVYGKYGLLQKNRVGWLLHNVSSSIVKESKRKRFGIVMEELTGIRKLYRKGNGQGQNYRSRLNSWSYYELQRQLEYKAAWEGIPVIYVDSRGTSSKCSTCGSKTYPNEHRRLYCPKCNISFDRDVNAAKNILARGRLRFSLIEPPNEAMVEESSQVILKVDGDQLT